MPLNVDLSANKGFLFAMTQMLKPESKNADSNLAIGVPTF
jgi:hypothetical protein